MRPLMYFTVPSGFESYEFDNPCILHFFGGPIPREFNYNYIQCGNHFYVLLGSCWWLIGKQLGVKCSTVFFNLELPQIMRPLMYFPFPSGLESYEFDNSCKLHFFLERPIPRMCNYNHIQILSQKRWRVLFFSF